MYSFVFTVTTPCSGIDIHADSEVLIQNGTTGTLRCSFRSNEVVSSTTSVTWTFQSNQPDNLFYKTPYTVSAVRGIFKGHILCKIHFFMSLLHQHVSPLLHVSSTSTCVPSVEKDSERFSLFLIHFYKNLSENELIRFWPLYDVITMFCLV